jgi:hypothetical protein
MNLMQIHIFEDVNAIFSCKKYPSSKQYLMSDASSMILADFFVRILFYFPLSKSITQRFDVIKASIVSAYGKSHVLSMIYFDIFKKR